MKLFNIFKRKKKGIGSEPAKTVFPKYREEGMRYFVPKVERIEQQILSITVCDLRITIDFAAHRYVVIDTPDYKTKDALLKSIEEVINQYNLKEIELHKSSI